ncbi:hypothetical protein GBAR_LOCUS12998 [Geodia barretti]|uniref:Death domain-containing protein n=1 Tax=Geodia barretti TaxID=519541 RepID=A0AA35S278_GEOBA|nr:hypothetical protein GBAR_LOCUS12998 [Geodia barretti]
MLLDKVSELVEFMFELREPEEGDESCGETKPEEKHTPDVGEKTTEPLGTPSDASNPSEPVSDIPSESSEVPSAAGEESSETSSNTAASTPENHSPEKELFSGGEAEMYLLPPGWQEFMKFGRITKQFLEDRRFSSHYKEGVFSCDDLIHLLEELLVFARLWNEEGPETWFMPSVLRHISASDMHKRCSSAGALVVDFPDCGPQSGVFCSLMSHVLSPENHSPYSWKLHLSSQEPSCLYRDCIQFEVPKYPGSVTFVDCYEYFEVHVFTSKTWEKELWGHVQKAVFGGIETVDETLGYSSNKPRPAIVCPRAHTDRPHPAYIQDKEWICTSDTNQFGDLTTQFLWNQTTCESSQESSTASIPTPSASGDETSTPEQRTPGVSDSSTASSVPLVNQAPSSSPPTPVESQLGIKDLFTVCSELVGVAHKWKKVGLALRLDPDLLDRIEAEKNDVEDNLSDTLKEWLKKSYDTESFGDPSWKLLVDAVAHPVGGKDRALAMEIAAKYNAPAPQ